ncbi:cytochrome P460 family protein [Stappia sp.]|uniref:cytochrome P460 family protein n=1 Tax=Stappia sp. TaxID=1870903 RepID=UPI003C7AE2AA
MHSLTRMAIAAGAFFAASGVAQAACDVDKPGSELSLAEAATVYHCLEEELHAGYLQGDKRWIPSEFVSDYRGWKAASDFPAAPGFHGQRYLVTFVNPVGEAEYMQFKEEGAAMPAGSVLAKESFMVNDDGKVTKGPLFLMQKVAAGTSPETGDWYYMAVTPGGTPMTMDVVAACSECHQGNFGQRDGLGYPVEEARAKP